MYSSIEDFLNHLESWDTFLYHGSIWTAHPHFQVVLNTEINGSSELIFLSVCTSNISGKERFISKRWLDPRTLVIVDPEEVSFLSKKSCFNCNGTVQYSIYTLYEDYVKNKMKPKWKLPENIIEKILEWVRISTLVTQREKDYIFWKNIEE